ncbi:little elongation complex subunit 2 isoform X2 [Myripristis murdjan]|uniref:little elongation complex subunit 2 isoform X2 n=1 Tax=Myripristis murdjan TaxID=586833 RepID=UPI001175CA04|nr:little elongation complex subunit 2 isoform X2 [Myripristis murdjan]
MELEWQDPPVTESPFFTRDNYDKYSLSPSIQELWAFLNRSPTVNVDVKQQFLAGDANSPRPSAVGAEPVKDSSCIKEEESTWDSCDSGEPSDADDTVETAEDCKDTKKSEVKPKAAKNELDDAYPEPRLPFPCVSSLSSREQKTYLGILTSKKPRNPPEKLKVRLNNEVMQFMRYLHDVSRMCAHDYSYISQGAMQYSEDFFRSCLECLRTDFPQLYQISEMTSLTGGTFNPGLNLTFEKQLLIMGNVDITDHKIVPADAQLASDYQSVSSQYPPAKKAKDKHATISSDSNAEKLCARYEPHVCLTRDAMVKLLDNHGPEFPDPWEMPVWVKLSQGKGSSQRKTVYIDSPLLKTEVTVRERSHIYHEESLKLSIIKTGVKEVFHLMTEVPVAEKQVPLDHSKRSLVSFESSGLDFEVDLTDLETFGETTTVKTSKKLNIENEQSEKAGSPIAASKNTRSSRRLAAKQTSSSLQEEVNTSLTDKADSIKEHSARPGFSKVSVPKNKQTRQDSDQKCEEEQPSIGDSEDDRLVIDDAMSPDATATMKHKASTTLDTPGIPSSIPESQQSPSPHKGNGHRRISKRAKLPGDQLGQILHMQTVMLNPARDPAKCSAPPPESISPPQAVGSSIHSHPTSLVKPCVSSYLESNQNQSGEIYAAPHHEPTSAANSSTVEQKRILSQELQASAEDEQDYEAPKEGNLLYKLYSLQDLLLMVRSSVTLTHTRRIENSCNNQHVPVHVLPKLEYQLCYGVECLSRSEACQLWAETLLHSSTVSYIAHINAHTSKVALLRKLPEDWKQNISCEFKPAKSLNILHHLLKKISGLEEGRYLIAHKAGEPFVTILKTVDGKVSRGAYSLQQAHSTVPQPPASGLIPWLTVDPAVVLPFHKKHGRVPCTFPPSDFLQTEKDNHGAKRAKQSNTNVNAGGKKKKGKRAARRNKWMKKTIQKSVQNPTQ